MNNDSLRAENKRLALQGAGKDKHMPCGRCDNKGVHWWMSGSWTCSGCEYVTTVQDRKRADGLTFRQYASARMKVYQDQINVVRNQAAAMLKQASR
jgi:ribosomal protein L37AE/L43A